MKFYSGSEAGLFVATLLVASNRRRAVLAFDNKTLCQKQAECFDVTYTKLSKDEEVCNGLRECEFLVCLTVNRNKPGCGLSDPLKYTCQREEDACLLLDSGAFTDAVVVENVKEYSQCKKVSVGNSVEFMLYDGDSDACGFYQQLLSGNNLIDCRPNDGCLEPCSDEGDPCLWVVDAPKSCETKGSIVGDPHIERWNQGRVSFHGECDLVLVHSPNFHKGIGLDVHVRTTIRNHYSFVDAASIRIGDYIVEIQHQRLYVDGREHHDEDLPIAFGEEFKYVIEKPIVDSKNKKLYTILLNQDSVIQIKSFRHFMSVSVAGHDDDFESSVGLLGKYPTGEMLARDGSLMDDVIAYGFEWQVAPHEAKLFAVNREPQLPQEKCRMPTVTQVNRRQLRVQNSELYEQAVLACAAHGADAKLCVNDILLTGDLEMVNAW